MTDPPPHGSANDPEALPIVNLVRTLRCDFGAWPVGVRHIQQRPWIFSDVGIGR
jgi:hypothetical protein